MSDRRANGITGGLDSFPPLMVGLCPAAVVSTRVIDAFWMSVGVVTVLFATSLCLSLLTQRAPNDIPETPHAGPGRRLLGALVISSFLAASFEMVLAALAPTAALRLGIYAPLIAVNCAVLGRVDAFEVTIPHRKAVTDAAGTGLTLALLLILIGFVRETLGSGSLSLIPVGRFRGTIEIGGIVDDPARALTVSGGAFLCLGYLAAVVRRFTARGNAAARSRRS